MNDLRKRALMELIDMRRRIEVLIQDLSGDPVHREFVQKHERGEMVRVRELRNYDVPLLSVNQVYERWGIDDPDQS
jgi:hypothetical protein